MGLSAARRAPLLIPLLVALPAGAQETAAPSGALLGADLRVAADASGALTAELVYRLRPAPGAGSIPLRVLPLPGAGSIAPAATLEGEPVSPTLGPDVNGMLLGSLPLSGDAGSDGIVVLELRYAVPRGPDGDAPVRVPLPAVPWPPAEALPGTFTARVDLPPGASLDAGFPATWARERPAGPEEAAPVRYRTELPVLPAFVSFRAVGADGEPVPPPAAAASGAPGDVPTAVEGPSGAPGSAPAERDPGFVFRGLFAVFGAIVATYLVWMVREERLEAGRGAPGDRGPGPAP